MKRIMKIASVAVLIVLMAASCRGEGEKTVEITESFSSIEVDGSETNIILKPSPDGKIRVVVDERDSVYYTAEVEKGVLKVERHKRAIDFNIFSLGEKKVEIMVEDKVYRSISISVASGKIEIEEGVKAEDMDFSSSSGNIKVYSTVRGELEATTTSGNMDIEIKGEMEKLELSTKSGSLFLSLSEAEEVQLESTSGTIKVSEVKAKEKMTISSASGSVRLDKCDGGEIDIETTSGSVKGTLLSSKAFDAASVSESVSVPSSKGKDECTIRTVSGSIDISLE